MCILSGNKTGEGLDAMLVRISLVVVSFFGFLYTFIHFRSGCPNRKHLVWMYAFWAFALISIMWADSVSDSLMYTNYYISILLVGTFMCYRIRNMKDVEKILKIFLVAGLYSVAMIIIRVPVDAYGTSTFGDYIGVFKNTLSARMVILTPIAMYFGQQKKRYYLAIPAFLFVIANADSRKGLALLVGAVLLSFLITSNANRFFRNILALLAIVFFGWFILESTGAVKALAEGVLGSVFDLIEKGFGLDSGDTYRLVLIGAGLTMFFNSPLAGYGLNNFRTYIAKQGYAYVVYSHNTYIELLSTLGLIGFLLYYPYLFYLMFRSFKMRNDSLMKTVFLILLVVLINDFGAVTYFDVYSQHLYIVLAAAVALCAKGRITQTKEPAV